MKLQGTCFVLGAALALTTPAWAQSKAIPPAGLSTGSTQTTTTTTVTETSSTGTGAQTNSTGAGTHMITSGTGAGAGTVTGTQTTTSTGAFQNLSPGGQKIARSLYNAQNPPTGTARLTLDQIAALKGKEGWGRVFKEMKADGLVQARNLGQVVSGHAQMTSTGTSTSTTGSRGQSTRTGGRNSTVVTNGAGRSTSFASGGGRYAGGYSTHYMTGSGMSMHGGGMPGGSFQGGPGFHGGGGGGGHGHSH